jgi:Tfp pilus assembly protein PilN
MFEVNFFEKKQRNFLPYVLGGAFLILLVLVGIYFFTAQAYYTKAEIRDQEWLQAEEEQLRVSRQMQEYAQLTDQVAENKATFEAKQYPMAFVTKAIIEQVPNGEQHVTIFNKNETNQITLVLEGLTVTEISEAVEKFKALGYVSDVQFISMENQLDGAGSTVELWLELDEAALREEVLS